ncbi:MAG: hypothetical protein HSCHL_0207 [Hydrogenibacillus schlegelii]|uniref:Uncharacterized protein n=1 Tax=Hydrogenibacillus schlegelii TaxID=1484 RepID=A0A2T5G3K3_HYDSH|nr:MAG: hypothetical protein HSCHL_0207 [Hydrogenibacillus schlegelii]
MEQKDVREERLGTPEVLYILQRLDAIDEKYDKKIEALRLELKGDILNVRDELKGEIKNVREELKNDIKGVRDELKNDIKSVRDELKNDIKGVRDELKNDIKGVRDELRETKKELTALFWRIVAVIVAVQGAAIAILQFLK